MGLREWLAFMSLMVASDKTGPPPAPNRRGIGSFRLLLGMTLAPGTFFIPATFII